MFCGKCGKENPDWAKYCKYCGAVLRPAASAQKEPEKPIDKKKKKNFIPLIILDLILIAILIIVMIFFVWRNKSEGSDVDETVIAEWDFTGQRESGVSEETIEIMQTELQTISQEETWTQGAEETTAAVAEVQEAAAEQEGIHFYEIVMADVTWNESFEDSISKGGYLIQLNSREEYDYIVAMLEEQQMSSLSAVHFYLGGCRVADGTDYYWTNERYERYGDAVNSPASWYADIWYKGEPSYNDVMEDGTSIPETCLNLFCVSGTWYLNDASTELAQKYPDYLTGKVGYIVEYNQNPAGQ